MVRSFLTLSTGHLRSSTEEWLSLASIKQTHWVSATPYGWFVYCDEDATGDDFPADLIAVFNYANTLGVDYVMFDSEVDPIEALPFYITPQGRWTDNPVAFTDHDLDAQITAEFDKAADRPAY